MVPQRKTESDTGGSATPSSTPILSLYLSSRPPMKLPQYPKSTAVFPMCSYPS